MTDRISGLYVVLDQDIREDDVEELVSALKMMRHVISVKPHVKDFNEEIAEQRARHDLIMKIYGVLK